MTLPSGPRMPAPAQVLTWGARPTPFLGSCLRRYGDGLTEHEVEEERKSPSTYAVLARAPEDLGTLVSDTRWITPAVTRRLGLWTDDFSSLLSVLR